MPTNNKASPPAPLLDTQLISYAMKGKPVPGVEHICIASVTAQEFLLQYSLTGTGMRYGSPLRKHLPTTRGALPKAIPVPHPRLEKFALRPSQLLVHVDGEEVHREYLHAVTAHILNAADEQVLRTWIRTLDRHTANVVLTRFQWLVAQRAVCIPLTQKAAAMTEDLYRQFTKRFVPKTRRENSVRDLLIVATALTSGRDLLTADRVLGEFAAEYLSAPIASIGPGVRITINDRSRKFHRVGDSRGSRGSYRHTFRR